MVGLLGDAFDGLESGICLVMLLVGVLPVWSGDGVGGDWASCSALWPA